VGWIEAARTLDHEAARSEQELPVASVDSFSLTIAAPTANGVAMLGQCANRKAHREDRRRDRQKMPNLLKITSYCGSLKRANIGKFAA
jgi:hypothetical protein